MSYKNRKIVSICHSRGLETITTRRTISAESQGAVKFRSLIHPIFNAVFRNRRAQHETGFFVRPLHTYNVVSSSCSSRSSCLRGHSRRFDDKNVSSSCCGSLTDWWITNAELYYILGWSVYTIQQYVAGLVKWVVRWCTEDDKVKKSGSVCLLTECLPEKRHARTLLHVLSLSYHLTLNRNSPSRVAARNWTVCGWRIKHRLL